MVCRKCGSLVSVLDHVCPECGYNLRKVDISKRYVDFNDTPAPATHGPTRMGPQGGFKDVGPSDVEVKVVVQDKVYWHLVNCGISFFRRLTITNTSYAAISNITVKIKLAPDYGDASEWTVPTIGSKEHVVFKEIGLPLLKERFLAIREKELAKLKIEVTSNGVTLFKDTIDVDVLAHNEWHYEPLYLLPLAGFVLPNSEAVSRVLQYARIHLEQLGFGTSLDGYQSGWRGPIELLRKVEAMAQAIYLALQKDMQIKYINPPASYEKEGQKIRLAGTILKERHGTCLDLALLYAACLEQVGLYPLIFLVPDHALLGVWMSDEMFLQFWANERSIREKTIVDDPAILLAEQYERYKQAIRDLWIQPLNSVTFTSDGNLDFKDCKAHGKDYCLKIIRGVVDIADVRAEAKPLPGDI